MAITETRPGCGIYNCGRIHRLLGGIARSQVAAAATARCGWKTGQKTGCRFGDGRLVYLHTDADLHRFTGFPRRQQPTSGSRGHVWRASATRPSLSRRPDRTLSAADAARGATHVYMWWPSAETPLDRTSPSVNRGVINKSMMLMLYRTVYDYEPIARVRWNK